MRYYYWDTKSDLIWYTEKKKDEIADHIIELTISDAYVIADEIGMGEIPKR